MRGFFSSVMLIPSIVLLLLWPNPSYALPPDPVKWVYRGDLRSPDEIKTEGGFLPPTDPTPPEGFSLYRHVRGIFSSTGDKDTGYVSTSASFAMAEWFASNRYVYTIHATPNMIDVVGTLGDYGTGSEAEYAALGGIHWNQVRGWTKLGDLNKPRNDFVENKDYSPEYDRLVASGKQPQLVGFPWNSPAWNDSPWNKFKMKTTEEYAREFMDKNGAAVGWAGHFPLFMSTYWRGKQAEIAAEAKMVVKEVVNAADEADEALRQTIKAQGVEGAETAAVTAIAAAIRAIKLTKRVAETVETNGFLDRAFFDKAWGYTLRAREAAVEANMMADTKYIDYYRQQVKDAKEAAVKGSDPDISKLAATAEEAASKVQKLTQDLVAELEDKTAQANRVKKLLASGGDSGMGSMEEEPGLVWLASREARTMALRRKLEGLEKETNVVQRGINDLLKKASETKADAQKIRKAAEKAHKAMKKAKEHALKLKTDATKGTWWEIVTGGLVAAITTVPAAAFLVSATAEAAAGAELAGTGLAGLSGISGMQIPILASVDSVSISETEVQAVVSSVVDDIMIEAMKRAPLPPKGVMGSKEVPGFNLMERAAPPDSQAAEKQHDNAETQRRQLIARVVKPTALRAVKAALEQSIKIAHEVVQVL